MKSHLCRYNTLMDELTTDKDPRLERLLFKICYHAAPTLEGVKPANLVMFRDSCAGCFQSDWLQFQTEIALILPIKMRVLGNTDKGINILFYNHNAVQRLLNFKAIGRRLTAVGYSNVTDVEAVLEQLSDRFLAGCPNEIGIILGYPLSDVVSFLEKKKPCLMKGYWCVYSNKKRAEMLFQRFDLAKQKVAAALIDGISPSRYLLTVRSQMT